MKIIEDRYYQRVDRPDLPLTLVQVSASGQEWLKGEKGLRGFQPRDRWTLVDTKPREPGDEDVR